MASHDSETSQTAESFYVTLRNGVVMFLRYHVKMFKWKFVLKILKWIRTTADQTLSKKYLDETDNFLLHNFLATPRVMHFFSKAYLISFLTRCRTC